MRLLVPAALLAACLVPLGAGPSTAEAATCQGETATIVGTPGGTVSGTEARDVVVSNRATSIYTRGGDDLVCVTGDSSAQVGVETGAGDDEVQVLGRSPVSATLDVGEDTFVGGPLSDQVDGGSSDEDGVEYDLETDDITTGGGFDSVQIGECGDVTVDDHVDLGSGGGVLYLFGRRTGPEADLGGGPDGLGLLRLFCFNPGPWEVDNSDPTAGTATDTGGSTSGDVYRWHDFFSFDIGLDELTFRGSVRPERLFTYGALDVDLGAGADDLVVWGRLFRGAPSVRGGPGRDTVTFDAFGMASGVTVDLLAATASWADGAATSVRFSGFERHGAIAPAVRILGGPGADDLFGTSCDLIIRAGAGRDVVRALDPNRGSTRCPGSRRVLAGGDQRDQIIGSREAERIMSGAGPDVVLAGPGADQVQGDAGDDELNGGRGRDTVLGGAGRDVCREAETKGGCER